MLQGSQAVSLRHIICFCWRVGSWIPLAKIFSVCARLFSLQSSSCFFQADRDPNPSRPPGNLASSLLPQPGDASQAAINMLMGQWEPLQHLQGGPSWGNCFSNSRLERATKCEETHKGTKRRYSRRVLQDFSLQDFSLVFVFFSFFLF